jgi:hypothetical protein
MKVRMFLLGLALAAVLIVPAASAQESFLYANTYGLFGNDIDSFMDPNDYKDVEFDNAFGVIQGGSYRDDKSNYLNRQQASYNGIAAGIATRIKGTYLGFYFNGNLWDGNTKTAYNKDNKIMSDPEVGVNFTGYFAALLGLKFGGIKVVLDFDNVYLNYDEDKTTSTDQVRAYSSGFTTVGLAWGNNFELKGGALDPEVTLAYKISNAYSYSKGSNTEYSYVPAGYYYFDVMSHLIINPGADYYLPEDKGHLFAFYTLDIGILPNEAVSWESNNTKIKWEGYDVLNVLELGYDKTIDLTSQFSFGYGGGIDLTLDSRQAKYTADSGKYNGPAIIEFGISPYVEIGGVYTFAKVPFSLNIGLQFASYEFDPVSGESVRANWWKVESVKTHDDKHDTGTFKNLGVDFGLGLGFTPFQNFSLDASLSKFAGSYIKDDLSYSGNGKDFWEKGVEFALQATIKF